MKYGNFMIASFPTAPWLLSFSYGRALQQPVLRALLKRARLNGVAQRGEYLATMESWG